MSSHNSFSVSGSSPTKKKTKWDFLVEFHGAILLRVPLSDGGLQWIERHIGADTVINPTSRSSWKWIRHSQHRQNGSGTGTSQMRAAENVSPISEAICGSGTIDGRGQDAFAGTAISGDRGDKKTFRSSNFGEDGTEEVRTDLGFALVNAGAQMSKAALMPLGQNHLAGT